MEVLVPDYGYTDAVKWYVNNNGVNLNGMITESTKLEIAAATGVDFVKITNIIQNLRKKKGILRRKPATVVRGTVRLDPYDFCVLHKFFRKNPKAEAGACRTIQQALIHWLPIGGVGFMFGTQSPFSVGEREFGKTIFTDNMDVASTLAAVSDHALEMIIGNGVNKKKAEAKAALWRQTSTGRQYTIRLDLVDRQSFYDYGAYFAEQYFDQHVKMVFMASGQWSRIPKPGDIDQQFELAAKELIKKYPNLHILAMVGGVGAWKFDIHYLHDGEDIIVDPVYKKR